MQASNLSLPIQAGLSAAGFCSFHDVDGNEVAPPSAPAVWTLMDQYFNAPADFGVLSVQASPGGLSATVLAIAPGTQGIKVEVAGVTPYYVLATVSPAPGPKPAATLIVTFTAAS